jgi:hypothetical protein
MELLEKFNDTKLVQLDKKEFGTVLFNKFPDRSTDMKEQEEVEV